MKKNGFTLAEVLITLTIIGVIATMTLPALLTNTQEQQAKTALKKGISTLTDIAQMNQAIDSYNFSDVGASSGEKWGSTDPLDPTLYAMLANRGSIDFQKSSVDGAVTSNVSLTSVKGGSVKGVMYFRDGSAILFDPALEAKSTATLLNDGLPEGYTVIWDTNGAKSPNVLSNCKGTSTGAIDDDIRFSTVDEGGKDVAPDTTKGNKVGDACKTKSNRVIKDQFLVRLRGDHAVPYGDAAVWAYEN